MTAVGTRRATDITKAGVPIKRLAILWAAGTGVAVLLVASAFLLAQEFANPLIVAGTGEVTLYNVTGFTILGATVGATLAYVIGRFVRRPRPTLFAVTLIALAGYAVVPFTAAESVQTAVWLNIFHVVVAVPVIGLLSRSLPGDRTSVEA
jgi:hypothetical protein